MRYVLLLLGPVLVSVDVVGEGWLREAVIVGHGASARGGVIRPRGPTPGC